MAMKIRDERQMKALTGLSPKQFDRLLIEFEQTYKAYQQRSYEEGLADGIRTRKSGGGQKGKLPEMRDKLEFILRYMKTYPTYDELAEAYDIARSSAHDNVKRLSPILADTLDRLGLLPKRKFETVEEFQEFCSRLELDQLLVDVTERPCRRHQDNQVQREHYSGKKNDIRSKT